jgi:hypothetical protein
MAKPILRVGKIKRMGATTLTSVDGHLSRSRPTPNADPARTGDNRWLVGGPGELAQRVESIMRKAGLDEARLRRDATVANDVLLTVSPEWFRPEHPEAGGTWDKARLATFRREAIAWLKEQFGPRLAGAVLHLDEATPHIQAVVVPVISEGNRRRLSGRDYFGPERLRALQDAWETRLAPHGVEARVRGSRARHTTLKAYYGALSATPETPDLTPSPPPFVAHAPLVGTSTMEKWQKDEGGKLKRRVKPLEVAAARGALYEAERLSATEVRRILDDQVVRNAEMAQTVQQLRGQAELSREETARLRGIPVNEVALALGFTGEIGRRENAIDLVKRVGELDYQGAVAWLHNAFGRDAAAAAAAEEARARVLAAPSPAPALTKAEQVKTKLISEQLDALAAPAYRVTIMRVVEGKKIAQVLGKDPAGGPEKFFTKGEILGTLPTLTAHNARNGNVFITPMDPSARHVLIDDLKSQQMQALRDLGYQPATILETSPSNYQVVVKVASDLSEQAANEWFKQLNREIGDARITGLVHPMRLAGFQNRKAKYETADGHFPFVNLVEAGNRFCIHARAVVTAMVDQIEQLTDQVRRRL